MAGRKAKLVSYQGKVLYRNGGASAVRVGFSKGNNTYVLFEGKNRILTRTILQDIAAEFYKYVGEGLDVTDDAKLVLRKDLKGPKGLAKKVILSSEAICTLFADLYRKDPYKAELLSGIPNLSKLSTIDFSWHTPATLGSVKE